jgi:nucleolar protein TMA23
MNARSILESYGWAGPGHPLHPNAYKQKGHRGLAYDPNALPSTTFASSGLIKPLLVSKKQGNLGVGRKAHEPQAGNEWWLKGFEKALGDVGKSESERSSGVSTPVAATPAATGKFGALYTYFVSGGRMAGSLEEDTKLSSEKRGKKRKSDEINGNGVENEFKDVTKFLEVRDKDVKRRKRKDKKSAEEEFETIEAFMEVRDGKSRKKRKSEAMEVDEEQQEETKEQRRERRRQRRAEKEAASAHHLLNGEIEGDDAARALRKAEKKRRKAERAARETK